MSASLSWLNSLGDGFVLFAIRMLIQSSVLILVLLLLDLVLRRRVRAVVRYWIWLLVLAKLVLPPSLSSPTSLVSWIGGRLQETTIVSFMPAPETTVRGTAPPASPAAMETPPSPIGANDDSPLQAAAQIPAPSATSAAPVQPTVLPTWQALVLLAWMAAVALMVVLLIQRVFFVRALLAQSQEAPDALSALLEQCRRHIGVRRVAGVRLTGLSASPSVCGLLRPVILMPEPMARQLEAPQLRSVLFHELAHIQRGDLWINLLQTLLQIVYLYHPLLWLANARIRAIREQAVDETVLATLGEEAEEYPRTLLSISKLAFGTPSLSLRLLGVVESKRALTTRIRHMVSRPFPRSSRLGLAGLIVVLGAGAALLPMARARSSTPPDPRQLLDRYLEAVTAWDKSVSMRIECDYLMNNQGRDIRHWKYDLRQCRDGDRWESFGRSQFEGELDDNPYSFNDEFRELVLDDYYLHYNRHDSGPPLEAFLGTDVGAMLQNLQVHSAYGSFLQGRTGGIGNATHQAQVMCDSNDVRYVGREALGGTLCHVVEAKTRYGTFTVWLAPEKGYNALKSVWRKSGRDILRENIRIEDQGIVEWTETVDAVEVQTIDGIFVPVAGRLTGRTKWASGGEDSEDHVTVQRREIVLHPDFQALGAFQIVLPEGTEVRLAGNSQRTFRWSQGKFTPDINKCLAESLLGKPLPGLQAIRMEGDPVDATGRMLMICLFDVQQRPSRNIALQIAKQADSLKPKGVMVMAIQAAKMNEADLKAWVKESQVPFPVGMIQGDEQEARAAWGVQALPWLILTDRDHIVRAEGFGLSDLQNKTRAVAQLPRTSAGPEQNQVDPLSKVTDTSATPSSTGAGQKISGVVVDVRGNPIAGASVTVENKDLLLLPQPEKIGGQIRRVIRADSTQTDSEGRFRFTDLMPGKTPITIAAAGYRTEFALSTATGTEDLRVVLGEPRPYRHSGVVADISCRPVADVEVTLVEETLSGPGKGKDEPPVTVHTNERGQYRFDRLLPPVDRQSVRRFLYARKAGYGAWGCEPDTTGGQATGIIRLMAEEKVSGVVTDETGAPIAGATVRLSAGWGYFGSIRFASTWQHLAPQTMTRADGSFTLGQLPTDSDLLLQVRAEGFASDGVWPVRTGQFGGYATRRGDTTSVMSTGGEPNTPLTITLQRAVAASKSDKPVLPPGATAGTKTEWPISAGGNGHFYQGVRMPKPLPWNEADGLAKLLGGHLVTITSAAENDFVFRLIDDDTYWYHSYNWRGPWIGAVQPPGSVEPADGWTWVTGEPFAYTRWDAGQPNNFNGSPEDRVHFGNQRSRIPTWNDVRENFEEVVSFVVEWEPAQQRAGIEWPVSQGGNGHLYQVVCVPEGLTWNEANTAAQARGGYLATLTSAEENAFVFALIQDPACWNGPRGPWIGGYQDPGNPVQESWHWVTGEPFEYNRWSPGQPNDGCGADETRLEYGWGATTPADTWNDQPDWFRGVYSYVVEREPGGPTRSIADPAPRRDR
jgi:beta-lactamase regulating signal transducer with metallopeptidase domain